MTTMQEQEHDFWDKLPEYVKMDVEEAKIQSERGEGKTTDEVMNKYKRWLAK